MSTRTRSTQYRIPQDGITRSLLVRAIPWLLAAILLLTVSVLGAPTHVRAQDATAGDRTIVYVLTFDGPITPVLDQYLEDAVTAAITADAEAIILQFDTPGGSVEVTKSITQRMLASPVPIVAYVAPAGAHAGSAGTFITLAAHVAAMAPGASIGAASPVDMSGGEIDATMRSKIENLLVADVENLAARRGEKATEWAVAAVREASAATAAQALELGVIDFIAVDVDDLLRQTDGFEVIVNQETVTLQTSGAVQIPLELTPLQRFLNLISNPTIAAILLSLGILGLFVEIRTPGLGFPGIVGFISLLLAFFGLGQLDANFAGMILIVTALILFVAEAFTPTFGILALGGVASFIFGAALLFNTPGVTTPWTTITALGIGIGAFAVFAGSKALAAQRRKPVTGEEALVGETATAKYAFGMDEQGSVFLKGEWWNATLLSGSVEAGDLVRVRGRKGYTLIVEPQNASQHASQEDVDA
jgi:membrane-bound serine protease (ClpP class)